MTRLAKVVTILVLLAMTQTMPAQRGLSVSTQGNDLVLKVTSQPGDTFSVSHSSNLEPPWTLLASNQPVATGGETTFTHSGALTMARQGFYFVELAGRIAFPGRDAQGRQQLYSINADGTDRRQLTFTNDNSMPSWSPDGARLVYVARTATGPEITIMDENGSNKRILVSGDAPDWGPHDQIAYTSQNATSQTPGPPAEIYVVDATGGAPRQVTSGGSHAGRVHPSWSPDGSRLVYMQLTPQSPATDDTSNGCPALPIRAELWIINADGTSPRLLTTTGFSNYNASGQLINSADDANAPDWSPAGDHITFWSGQEQCYGQVWRINADGTGRTQLTKAPIPSHNDDPAWSPGGRQILFTTDRNGRIETWVMNADGSNPRFLTESAPGPGPGDAAWQPVRPPP